MVKEKIKEIWNLVVTQGLHGVCIQKVRVDLTKDEFIQNLVRYFPTERWKYLYSKGKKPAGTPGQGLLTLIEKIDDATYEIEINARKNRDETMTWHTIHLKVEDQEMNLTHFYLNPRNTKLDENLKKDIENSDSSFGDLNKTATTYPVRNRDYQLFLDNNNLVELITQKTRIPKTVKGAETPTTDPDSAMSYCNFNESVRFIGRETLRSDHLAYVLESDFNWLSKTPNKPKYGHYFAYSSLKPEFTRKCWDECTENAEKEDVWNVISKIHMNIRRYGVISPKPRGLRPECKEMSTDEIFEQQIVSTGKMCNLREVFELEGQIKRVRESLEEEVKPKLSRKRRKVWFGKFQRQVATARGSAKRG